MRAPRPRPARTRVALLLLTASAVLAGACVGPRPSLGAVDSTSTTGTDESTTTLDAAPPPPTRVATAKERSITLYDTAAATTPAEDLDAVPDGVLTADVAVDAPGIPIVFLVRRSDAEHDRHEVYLPVRPNGSTAWVDDADVKVAKIPYRITVDLSDHRLQVFEDDDRVLDAPIAVGASDTPSPGGTYYLKELLEPPDPEGTYGPYAYGLSGYSNERKSFADGEGVIGIHGTDNPSSIGTDVPHGSIGLDNEQIDAMVHDIGLPLGTPVEIQA